MLSVGCSESPPSFGSPTWFVPFPCPAINQSRALKLPQTGISLKKNKDDDGDYTADELFEVLSDIYAYVLYLKCVPYNRRLPSSYRFVFLNVEASKVMVLQEKIKKAMPKIMDRITDNFNLGNGTKVNVA